VADARAEAQLSYRLDGPHVAVVLSSETQQSAGRFEAVSEAVMAASGASSRLTLLAGANEVWVWYPVARLVVPEFDGGADGVLIAAGSVGHGREGFRRSHFQALSTRRLLRRFASSRRFATYDDLRLVDVMADDDQRLDDFVAQTLGELAAADDLRECLHAWFAEECNASATARRLYTHRNTVVRRIARAQELLPIPLNRNAIAVAAALELAHWRE
ncbi:MAG: helix-turn-helix domain-containing protein, partial [Gordonia sp. (in: high G+C Gram-positive bacteria)]